jgi:excisionase family DNA binding protein
MSDAPQTPDTPSGLPPLADGDRWMTTEEIAAEQDAHIETVRRWIRDGHLPAQRDTGRWMVKRSDVIEAFSRGRAKGRPPGRTAGRPGRDPESIAVPGDHVKIR